MKQDFCVIIAGGDIQETIKTEHAFVICADCGYRHALRQNVRPDVLIGDFDSYTEQLPEGTEIIHLPVEKDVSDTWAAMEIGQKLGYQEFIIYGAFGGERADHSFANLQLLHHAAKLELSCKLIYREQEIFVFSGTKLIIPGRNRNFSLFSLSEQCTDVTITGAKYLLEHGNLKNTFPLGLSNEVSSEQAEITIQSGELLVFQEMLSHNS